MSQVQPSSLPGTKRVVIGGHSRNIGKTSVMSGIIHDLSDLQWTAIKVTQYGHGICSVNGKSCHCSTDEHRFMILEEKDRSGKTDTSRFLAAGAKRSFWVRTKQGRLFEALPELRETIGNDPFVILESNSILRFMKPELYVVVLDFSIRDFKPSLKRVLDLADAYVVYGYTKNQSAWHDVSIKPLSRKPVFELARGNYRSDALSDYVRRSLFSKREDLVH